MLFHKMNSRSPISAVEARLPLSLSLLLLRKIDASPFARALTRISKVPEREFAAVENNSCQADAEFGERDDEEACNHGFSRKKGHEEESVLSRVKEKRGCPMLMDFVGFAFSAYVTNASLAAAGTQKRDSYANHARLSFSCVTVADKGENYANHRPFVRGLSSNVKSCYSEP